MADVKLLPLPEGAQIYGRDEMHAYARANIAPLQAENERLRAEVDRLRQDRDDCLAAREHYAGLYGEQHGRAERLAEALRWAERHCPCGARPESPETHPHVPGCLVGAALAQEDRNG